MPTKQEGENQAKCGGAAGQRETGKSKGHECLEQMGKVREISAGQGLGEAEVGPCWGEIQG